MVVQPDYNKLLEPIADVNTSIESLLAGAFGQLTGDAREGLKQAYASSWGLYTLLLDIVTNIGLETIARRAYLAEKFDGYIDALINNAQNLIDGLDGILNEEQLVAVEFILISGLLLQHYVANLWLYSRLSNDLYLLDKQTVTLESILDPAKWSVTDNPVDLELFIPEDVPSVRVDAFLMQTAISQIVTNAMNYTDKGNIQVSVRVDESQVTISVVDTGNGIPSEHLEDILTPFFQVNPEKPGLGLGLPIAQKSLLLHQGSLAIESSTGIGTTALLRFPRH